MIKGLTGMLVAGLLLLGTLPNTTNYKLQSFGFGSGGTANSTTSNYALEGTTGEISGQTSSTANYSLKPGFIETEQANVPKVTISNPSSYYDKLKFVIDEQGNPSDAKYALSISIDNFASDIRYVKSDLTVGATLTTADYQTYATWGGASGANIIGLAPSTTYYLRAKATQGKYTESAYGPSTNAATVGAQLSYCVYSSVSCSATNTEAFGSLLPGTVTTAGSNPVGIDFATNANAGGKVYVYSANGGLKSAHANNYVIGLGSSQVDLTSASEGYGAQVATTSQTSGGPINAVTPYDGSSNVVGKLNTTAGILLKSLTPIVGGHATVNLKAKAANTTPAANDYVDTLTLIAAAAF